MATSKFAGYRESPKETRAQERREPKALERFEKRKGMEKHAPMKTAKGRKGC